MVYTLTHRFSNRTVTLTFLTDAEIPVKTLSNNNNSPYPAPSLITGLIVLGRHRQ